MVIRESDYIDFEYFMNKNPEFKGGNSLATTTERYGIYLKNKEYDSSHIQYVFESFVESRKSLNDQITKLAIQRDNLSDSVDELSELITADLRCIQCKGLTELGECESFTNSEIIGGEVLDVEVVCCNRCYEIDELKCLLKEKE